jgi:hypothetical protein
VIPPTRRRPALTLVIAPLRHFCALPGDRQQRPDVAPAWGAARVVVWAHGTAVDDGENDEQDAPPNLAVWPLRALARHLPLSLSQKAKTGYLQAHRGKWLALARVLGRASDGDYARARETARAMRAESKSVAFRHAVAMAFPSEPWATEDARAYV